MEVTEDELARDLEEITLKTLEYAASEMINDLKGNVDDYWLGFKFQARELLKRYYITKI